MSDRKKSRVIRVDKLIIHADDVVIVPRGRIRDPWLFPHRIDVEAIEDVHEESPREDHEHDDRKEERRPFSWI
ncbi:hypothetical protein ABET52_17095 [Saccharococcus caldoxylosilyticus]|uniref:Uncharacterized protein n=1 Tax=Saccharococcus caldoxylosilyticus TaxID=81408 RepID=A0A150LE88_9BACL|nr:hypothetical protein [Parageobacillus caldoxylosilyticus]QNU38068.1 hypothetical protein IC801_01570 [Geobacillus sp. 44B]KYD10540.1 hypothetical protein B4119_0880 [Parageobacillus caldoxylosilyticus]QXJ37700.1 hypothetical protein BV455_00963 [Parageobacillus caldoxylosilyticus]BDG34829.1 hypothetical protein PcaKH15_07350 [Parageobacillus caldoxylosilyticus]BDG38603.1 hypothetical protein PcaKH16_07420 [Parageobacillus caldoxylosilyticus]